MPQAQPELRIALTTELIDALADAVERRLGQRADGRPYLTPEMVAEQLLCPKNRVYDLIAQGQLSAYRDGRRILVTQTQVDEYLGVRR
jgi:excisionase family DNA binding protein